MSVILNVPPKKTEIKFPVLVRPVNQACKDTIYVITNHLGTNSLSYDIKKQEYTGTFSIAWKDKLLYEILPEGTTLTFTQEMQ